MPRHRFSRSGTLTPRGSGDGSVCVVSGPICSESRTEKLLILDAATLNDSGCHRATGLEQLRGARAEQHSIRINDQWRICFIWTSTGPTNVEITDYH